MSEPASVLDEDLSDISLDDEIACVKRELAMRERNYPKWVQANRMKAEEAARELKRMRKVLQRLLQAKEFGTNVTITPRPMDVALPGEVVTGVPYRLCRVITDNIKPKTPIGNDSTLQSLGADSVDYQLLMVAIEEEFSITLTDDEIGNDMPFTGVVQLIEQKRKLAA